MQKIAVLLMGACMAVITPAWSQQKFKLSAFAGTGLSKFSGSGATDNSVYYRNGLPFPNDIDTMRNPYGRKAYGNFVAGLQADLSLSPKWVLIVAVQYEHTGAKLTGDSVLSPSGNSKVSGSYTRKYDNISFNPQIGRVVFQKAVKVILHGGFDYTSKLSVGDDFDYTDPGGQRYIIGKSGGEPEVNDFRISMGATVSGKKWGIGFNYKHGLTNYMKYGNDKVFSRLLHLRIIYTFLNK